MVKRQRWKNTGLERDTEGQKKGRKATKIKEGEVKETEKRKRQMLKETDAKRYRDRDKNKLG